MNRVTQRERDALRMAAQRVVRLDANGNLVGDLYDIAARLAQQEHVSNSRAMGAVSRTVRQARHKMMQERQGG